MQVLSPYLLLLPILSQQLFIPDLYLAFNYKLILALLFVLLSWQSKGKFLFFLGMAFLVDLYP